MTTLGDIAALRERLMTASPAHGMPGRREWNEAMHKAQRRRNAETIRMRVPPEQRYGLVDILPELIEAVAIAERRTK